LSADLHDLQPAAQPPPEVFISYAQRDFDKVRHIADELATLGVNFWLDREAIEGGTNYALAISRGIKQSRVVILMCTDASLRSRNVNKEIMLAWRYERPYLPLLLEPVSYPEQVEYFLEGCQWIEVLDRPAAEWLPRVQRALNFMGVGAAPPPSSAQTQAVLMDNATVQDAPSRPDSQSTPTQPFDGGPGFVMGSRADLASLRALASFTDRVWPVPARSLPRDNHARTAFRGLGAPQPDAQHGHRLGSRLGLAIESERDGHLLLLDEGPEGIVYCLCPSWFAPDTRIPKGRSYLPQAGAHYESFQVSGVPGREQLLAIIADQPLAPADWMPHDLRTPARVLDAADIELLLAQLRQLDPTIWAAFATYFDVVR
jgi:hypothetical protein